MGDRPGSAFRPHRLAVVSSGASAVAIRSVCETIRRDGGEIEPVPLDLTTAAPPGYDGILALTDSASMPRVLAAVERWLGEQSGTAILLVGIGLGAAELATMLRSGVHDFVSVPFDPQELITRLRRILGLLAPPPGEPSPPDPRLRHFIGANPAFRQKVAMLPVLARCDATVLVTGETGTGKEIFAQAIHYLSPRASRPWVAVNCGAIPAELIENELFGHVKGAYTTAHAARKGLVSEAEGGTLFLDDMDGLPLPAQVKLLRFLQEQEYRPVGANVVQHANVRIIAASNRPLGQIAARGEFRQDLYFRLNVLSLDLPPLRERRDDVRALADSFIRQFSVKYGRVVVGLTPRAADRLMGYSWPGNVRELQHAVERAVLMAAGPMLSERDFDIAEPGFGGETDGSFRAAKARVVRQFERSYIENLLASCGGNVTHAAQRAGKNRRAFFELMRKHAIAPARFRQTIAP